LLVLGCLEAAGAQSSGPARPGEATGLGAPFRRFHAPKRPGSPAVRRGALAIGLVTTRGDALAASRVRGASLAVDEANRKGGCRGLPLELCVGQARGPWSSAAEVARDFLFERECLALIAPPDRNVSHLLQQLAARGHAPVVALSSDSTLTRVPVPWLVRIVPDTRAEITALVRALSEPPAGAIPALIPAGREGRTIRGDLNAVARRLGIAFDPVLEVKERGPEIDGSPFASRRAGPVLVWLSGRAARASLEWLASCGWNGPVLLPRSFFAGGNESARPPERLTWMAVRLFDPASREATNAAFVRAYRRAFGASPNEAAACAHDAVSLLVEAIRGAGPSRSAIRDWLAAETVHRGITGPIRFDGTGNRDQNLSVEIRRRSEGASR